MALITEHNQLIEVDNVYDDGYLRVEYDNYLILCNGNRIKLTKSEFFIISRLTQSPQRIVSYEELWGSIWNGSRPYSHESLKVYIYRLRRIFEPFGITIETLVGVGYRFIPTERT